MRTTSTLDDTLGEKSSEARAPKRPRESTGESARLNKRRKIGRNVQELDVSIDYQFGPLSHNCGIVCETIFSSILPPKRVHGIDCFSNQTMACSKIVS